jgi:hypothetical protein
MVPAVPSSNRRPFEDDDSRHEPYVGSGSFFIFMVYLFFLNRQGAKDAKVHPNRVAGKSPRLTIRPKGQHLRCGTPIGIGMGCF